LPMRSAMMQYRARVPSGSASHSKRLCRRRAEYWTVCVCVCVCRDVGLSLRQKGGSGAVWCVRVCVQGVRAARTVSGPHAGRDEALPGEEAEAPAPPAFARDAEALVRQALEEGHLPLQEPPGHALRPRLRRLIHPGPLPPHAPPEPFPGHGCGMAQGASGVSTSDSHRQDKCGGGCRQRKKSRGPGAAAHRAGCGR
jgi:hypothetical protein